MKLESCLLGFLIGAWIAKLIDVIFNINYASNVGQYCCGAICFYLIIKFARFMDKKEQK